MSALDLIQCLDPFMELPAENAAALLGLPYPRNLETADVGDTDFVPYIPHQGRRTFLLGDVITVAMSQESVAVPKFPDHVATTTERANEVLARRVGPQPVAWHDESRHLSNEDIPSAASGRKPLLPLHSESASQGTGSIFSILVGSLAASGDKQVAKPASRPAKQVSGTVRVGSATVRTNIAKFASLSDFMREAMPDDEWIIAVPPKGHGRPYDFLESLFAEQQSVRWVVMTYRCYLSAMLAAAIEDHGAAIGLAEKTLLDQAAKLPND